MVYGCVGVPPGQRTGVSLEPEKHSMGSTYTSELTCSVF